MKRLISPLQMNEVNWTLLERAFRKKNVTETLPIFNLLHNKWPVNMDVTKWEANKKNRYAIFVQ